MDLECRSASSKTLSRLPPIQSYPIRRFSRSFDPETYEREAKEKEEEEEKGRDRIKESSESKGRRPWFREKEEEEDDDDDDDAFLSGNMAGSSEANEKVRATLVSLGCQPNPTDDLPRPLPTTFMPAFRETESDPGATDRAIKSREDGIR